jgi:hypothetical protein
MPGLTPRRSNVIPLLGVVIAIVAVLIYAFRKKPDPPVKHDPPVKPDDDGERGPITVESRIVDRFRFMRPHCPGDERLIVDSAQYTEGGGCVGQVCLSAATDITGVVQNIFDSAPGAVMTEKDIGRPLPGTLKLKMHCP